jgi:tetratricopeptide (TPR) repeat protein
MACNLKKIPLKSLSHGRGKDTIGQVNSRFGRGVEDLGILSDMTFVISLMGWALLLFLQAGKVNAQPAPASPPQQLAKWLKQVSLGDTTVMPSIYTLLEAQADKGEYRDALHTQLHKMTDQLADEDRYEEAIGLLRTELWYERKTGNKSKIPECQVDLVYNFLNNSQADSAQHYLQQLDLLPESELSAYTRISLLNVKGILASRNRKYLDAIEYYWKALNFPESERTVNTGVIKENIGDLYMKLGNFKRGSVYLQEARVMYEAHKDSLKLARLYSNLGIVFMRMDSLDRAGAYHRQAMALSAQNSLASARSMANYANVLRRQGFLDAALQLIDSSTHICERLNLPFGVAINLVNRANVLLDQKKPAEAIKTLKEAEKYPSAQTPDSRLEIYDNYQKVYNMLGNAGLAYSFLNKHRALKDSLDKSGAHLVVQEWEENIQRTAKEKELAAINAQLYQTKQRQLILFSLLGILVLLALAAGRILYLRTQRQELVARLAAEESENLRLTLEIKERELASQTIQMQALGSFAEDISGKLNLLKVKLKGENAEELSKIIRDFENGLPEQLWEDFRLRFEKVNEDFYHKLLQLCPDLTPVEIKIASFLRLNLSSKEISRLTNRSAGTISNTRSLLRKKLQLDEEDNLVAFLMSL